MTPPILPSCEIVDGIAVFRLVATCRFERASRLIASAIAQAAADGHAYCLINALELHGFASPSIPSRHQMVRSWALASEGRVNCAVVVRPQLIDHERFGVVAARNFGLHGDVFETEDAAHAWLASLMRPSAANWREPA
jgi:hypothetical protein